MEKLHHIFEMIHSSDHVPAVLAVLIGALVCRREVACTDEDQHLGDNVPTTLMEGLGR